MATAPARLMTADEFWDWLQQPGRDGRHWELVNGEIDQMPPPGNYAAFFVDGLPRSCGSSSCAAVADGLLKRHGAGSTSDRKGREHITLDETEELTGEDVLPDFRCKVAGLFTLPGTK